jgi:DNA-binding transcriptional LysR family regulator
VRLVGHPQGVELPVRFEAVSLARFTFHAVCLASHPFAILKKPTLRDLLKHPLILGGANTSSRIQFDHLVSKCGLCDHVNVSVTASNLSVILNYVVMGLGVALLTMPAHEATPMPADIAKKLVFRNLSQILGHDHIVLLHPKGRYELAHVKTFREMVLAGLNEGG